MLGEPVTEYSAVSDPCAVVVASLPTQVSATGARVVDPGGGGVVVVVVVVVLVVVVEVVGGDVVVVVVVVGGAGDGLVTV